MSPDLTFILTLMLRMAVTAAFVVSASVITERSGPAIGAYLTLVLSPYLCFGGSFGAAPVIVALFGVVM